MSSPLNDAAAALLLSARPDFPRLGVNESTSAGGATVFDFSAATADAGLLLTRLCLAGRGDITRFKQPLLGNANWPHLRVATADAVGACLRSQVAAYSLSVEGYAAQVSGPIRTCFEKDGYARPFGPREENPRLAVAVLEGKLPNDAALAKLAQRAGVPPNQLLAVFAPTRCPAGVVQILGRVVETAVKRLVDLKRPGFDPACIRCAVGTVPECPAPSSTPLAMAMTNEAAIYGGCVTLFVDADDALIADLVSHAVSSAAPDLYGRPFAEVMAIAQAGGGFDFAAIEHVFAPASLAVFNERSGRLHSAGDVDEAQLRRSFG